MAERDDVFGIVLAAVRFLGPAILVLVVLSLLTLKADKTVQDPSPIVTVTVPVVKPRRTVILTLLSIAALTYLLDGTVVILRAVFWKTWEGADTKWTGVESSDVLGLVAFGLLIIIGTWKDAKDVPVWTSRRVKIFAAIAVVFEVAQVVLQPITLSAGSPNKKPPHIPGDDPLPGVTLAPFLHFTLSAVRLQVLIVLLATLAKPITTYVVHSDRESSEATAVAGGDVGESSGLLAPVPTQPQYGTFLPPPSTAPSIHSASTPGPGDTAISIKPKPIKENSIEDATWRETFGKLRRLLPYLWPHKSRKLKFLASLCFGILLISRVVNLLLPLTLRQLVDKIEQGKGFPVTLLLLYAGLRFLQGSGGLNAIRDVIWAPVMQYSDREMSQLSFDHLLNLSLSFHTKRKTCEILRILDRGSAINHVFEVLLFNIIPTFVDIAIALGAFFYFFGPVLSAIVLFVMVLYVTASVELTKWRTKLRRAMNDRDIITRGIHTDCLLNYDTVKYFGGEEHEGRRYRDAIEQYQTLEFKVITSLNLLNFVQNFIISTGLLVGSLIVAWRVVHAGATAADFVFFITYLAQLYGPLNMLGFIYRTINQNLVDTEKLLKLLNEPTDVNDKPGAPDLVITDGVITFENVRFSYDNKTTALHDVSFSVPKGSSVALVGESGGGKSTLLRLLFRQYDLKEGGGRILIDGQDIRDVTQRSLRQAIGVVPQDSVLFNDSIGYNIGYGKFGASQEEIEAAAVAAQLHDRILSFPDGYNTKVGERGVRLSGGEKQRVAIARTYLKNSPILVLDEATSALDTATEKDIQRALHQLAEGRTSISIAHRLSTIVSADIILVLKDGHIVESGSHQDLLARNGIFAAMWEKQVSSSSGVRGLSVTERFNGDVKGYEVGHGTEATEATIVTEVISEPEGLPIFGPGPVITALPPTEYEKKLAEGSSTYADALQQPSDNALPSVSAPPIPKAPELSTTMEVGPAPVEPTIEAAKDRAPGETVVGTYTEVVSEEPADEPIAPQPATMAPPIEFPTSAPVAFPTSDDSSSRRQSVAPTPASIQFKELAEPPREPGYQPSEDKEPKRKRISSQNFQRLARRLSLGMRKGSSSSNILPSSDTPARSREASVDLGSTGRNTPVSSPPGGSASVAQAAIAASQATSAGSDSDANASTSGDTKRRLRRKKPTKS